MLRSLALTASALVAAPLAAQTPASPAPPGDATAARLNALEARIKALEARNAELEQAATAENKRVVQVETRVAKGVQPGVAPTFADPTGDTFTFHPRGVIQVDFAAYHERAGGYDANSGTDIRRARFGFDGTAFRTFRYRIEAEYVHNAVNLLDAYIQYAGVPDFTLTIGQHKAPYGLEANSLDWFATFLERGMAGNAFGAVGAERRVGVSVAYQHGPFTAAAGLFGAGEAVTRNPITPDEAHGVNGRVTFEPTFGAGRQIHLGAAAYHVSQIAAKTIPNLGDRPDTRVDGGLIESLTIGPVTTGPLSQQTRGVRSATFLGGEAAGVVGPFSLQGEYDHLSVNRYDGVPTLDFSGFYAFASLFVTGESRSFRNGVVERVRPLKPFDLATGGWGAVEFAVRYDRLDLTDLALSPLRRRAATWTGGINWYLNPAFRVIFNYIRFTGVNSPLVALPPSVFGTSDKGDAYATRLQVDF